MSRTPIGPRKLSDSIVSHIEDLILNGVLKPGDKLTSERELAKQLDVSRTSLRDAMVKLEARGLLDARHSGGTFIRDIIGPTVTDPLVHLLKEHPAAMLDLLEIREALEKIAAYHAAGRANEPDRRILAARFADLNRSTRRGNPARDAITIADYYLAVADASHNIALIHVMRGLFNLMRTSISRTLEVVYQHPGTYEVVHRHRTDMHEAILAGDPESAEDAANAVIVFLHKTVTELNKRPRKIKNTENGTFSAIKSRSVKPNRLSDAVVAKLEELIMTGRLKAGDQLPQENTLARELAVSRAVLRDALAKLDARGVVTIKRGGGSFICDVPGPTVNDPLAFLLQTHPEAVFDFLQLRGSLEELCVALAAERRSNKDIANLKRSLRAVDSCFSAPDPFYDADKVARFHIALADASHNVALVYVVRGLFNLLRSNIRANLEKMHAEPNNYELVLQHHHDIFGAIVAGDPEKARTAAHVHITFVIESLRQLGVEQKRVARSQRRFESLKKERKLRL